MYDVIVVGAGASGMMAAATAASLGKSVLLVEKNSKTGEKIRITGKGRCNVTNNCDVDFLLKNIVRNPKFMYSSANAFSCRDTMSFFQSLGVELKTERGNRVFPVSDNAEDICRALTDYCMSFGVKIVCDTVSKLIIKDKIVTGVVTSSQKEYLSGSVIVATGGISYPKTGSTGDGYKFAKEAGHNVISPRGSLVALVTADEDCKNMQGLSLKNTAIKLCKKSDDTVVYSDMGEMLFTHFGISGPIVLSASAYINGEPKDYYAEIDLKPALDFKKLDERISRDFKESINKDFLNSLSQLLPKKMIPTVIKRSKIDEHLKVNQITREQREMLCNVIKKMRFDISDKASYKTAIITAGGVSTDEINPKTMQSKLVKGLFFAGEVIDVDACTGGFNLQIAFSTGYCAGLYA